ncbi:MAG TPA: hypothetical protein ENI76_00685 [Ignavibacteria bacterium]|nr:hypothetical protein [Ignavibacteria bacterium]
MEKHQPLITYLLTFIVFAIFLKLLGIIDFANSEILGYALIFYGISSVYLSLEENYKLFLFTGTIAFLIGVVLFLINYFSFYHLSAIIVPALLFILGISFLMLFINDKSYIIGLLLFIIFSIIGLLLTIKQGTISLISFLRSIVDIFNVYWSILIAIMVILFVIKRSNRKREKK